MANSALSEVQAANLTANTTASTAASGLTTPFNEVGSMNKMDTGGIFMFGGIDKAGINTEKVEPMKAAIDEYVTRIDGVLNKLDALSANDAFGTEIGGVVATYVLSVKNACKSLVSNLGAFKDDLDSIKKTYEAKAESMKTAVNTTSSNVDQAASQYKYSGGSN